MEAPGGGILGRLAEKALGWIVLGLLIACGVALWYYPETRAEVWNGIWRTVAWVAIAAGLPWISRVFIARLVAVGSNWVGVILIAALVAVDALAGLALLSDWPNSGWGWTAVIAALAAAGTYNYLVTEYLAEQVGG